MFEKNCAVVADYGRGVRQSLSCAVSDISSDIAAVEMAFTKRVSGRAPEQRGNGLKFVLETVQQKGWHLYFQSGNGCTMIEGKGFRFFTNPTSIIGCLAVINFDGGKQ